MILRSPTEHENADLRHAGMDASGDIHVNLDSSTPCWNDPNRGVLLELTEAPPPRVFEGGGTKDTKEDFSHKGAKGAK